MKLLVVVMVAVTAVMANSHHDYTDASKFADYLKDIRKSHEFAHMDATEQALYQQLIQAAEQGSASLTSFISAQTFANIIRLIDHLDKDDIPHFEGYLEAVSSKLLVPLAITSAASPNNRSYQLKTMKDVFSFLDQKRQSGSDLFSFLRELHLAHKIEDDLSHADMRVFLEILYAAEHNTLTQYIDQKGYAAVLDLMSQIEDDQVHGFDQLLIRHLEHEAAMSQTTVGTIVVSTPAPVMTTPAPMMSTAAPVMTTAAPMMSTAAPVVASTVMG
ncbi:uncharacterized protein LOC124253030 [Haliotis rubra]|uniref:uncharacterized protein LOC124253030 n=1 Tax=Haliotis rubra TaxID=36100 RepID=UPI001EE6252E|nr:uncharacterized protein LOC124253030 [Haliotis rubra]